MPASVQFRETAGHRGGLSVHNIEKSEEALASDARERRINYAIRDIRSQRMVAPGLVSIYCSAKQIPHDEYVEIWNRIQADENK